MTISFCIFVSKFWLLLQILHQGVGAWHFSEIIGKLSFKRVKNAETQQFVCTRVTLIRCSYCTEHMYYDKQGHRDSLKRNYWVSVIKQPNQMAKRQEMETDYDHTTMRESFSLAKNILSLTTLTYFLLISRNIWLKNCGRLCIFFFDNGLWRELLV